MTLLLAGGRGRATKQDGRLERELRAEAVPEGRRGREDSRKTHRVRCPSTPTTAATQNHVRGPCRSGTQGRKLATRPRPIRPDKRGGVASSEDRGRRARSGKEQAEQAAGTAGAVTTRISLQHQQTPVDLRPPTGRRGDTAKGCGPFDSRERNPVRESDRARATHGSLETQINTSQEREQDFIYLRSKLTDMEDRSRRDNIRVLGIPENEEGLDMQAFLTSTLPKMISLDFDLPLEFQRAHRIGPKRSDNSSIIACLLRHNQTRQILQVARNHGPFRIDQHEIRITADYSKETNERRKAFLALRPRLRKLEMKYGLFDPARMWVTKNGVSKDFYNPDELRLFLDSFQSQPMDSLNTDSEHDIVGGSDRAETPHSGIEKVKTALHDTGASHRGRDMERLTRSYDDRGQILHAVVTHTQLSERDKSRSSLKPTTGSS
ncbi:hypothetical protein NDU88_003088 [Pleurodeles waltl]|uniref:Uncharacterized protein n=1 Tax=Pleurodeles waltl TaxID=8319 RepID=A0AAV7W509_PLEWA|nr:hypothetical protein NDU88_003088 [Pleurodeles waltl]